MLGVPDANGVVRRDGRDEGAVRIEGGRLDGQRIALQRRHQAAAAADPIHVGLVLPAARHRHQPIVGADGPADAQVLTRRWLGGADDVVEHDARARPPHERPAFEVAAEHERAVRAELEIDEAALIVGRRRLIATEHRELPAGRHVPHADVAGGVHSGDELPVGADHAAAGQAPGAAQDVQKCTAMGAEDLGRIDRRRAPGRRLGPQPGDQQHPPGGVERGAVKSGTVARDRGHRRSGADIDHTQSVGGGDVVGAQRREQISRLIRGGLQELADPGPGE